MSGSTDNKLLFYIKDNLRLIIGIVAYVIALIFKGDGNLLSIILFATSYLIIGGDVVLTAIKNIARGEIFDENFLMSIATIGAFFIGEYPEAVAVMLFYQVGEMFQGYAVNKSRKSISSLMNIRADYANVLRDNKEIPTTSQVTYMTFKETFEKYVKEGKKVLYMAGSSKGSGTYQSAMLAKNDIESDDIYIFDTYSLCIGGGLLVLEAAKMVEEGLDIDTIIKKLEEYKDKVQVYFSVDSLDYLYKGGRISGTKAAVGSLLNIKPILKIEDGLVKQKTQVRGSKKIIPTLIEKLKEEIGDDFSDKDIYVGYGDDLETNEKFVEKVKEELSPKNVYTFRIGSCVACHSGPTVIGIACLNK